MELLLQLGIRMDQYPLYLPPTSLCALGLVALDSNEPESVHFRVQMWKGVIDTLVATALVCEQNTARIAFCPF